MVWANLLAGVASSLIAIAIIELYHFLRRHYAHRPLRQILGTPSTYGIATPAYPETIAGNRTEMTGLLTTDNAYALADVIEACRLVGARTIPAPALSVPSDFPDNQILLGGHIANRLTFEYLTRYCPGLAPKGDATDSPARAVGAIWYECDGKRLVDSKDIAWSFIIRLNADVTGQDRTIVLLFGRSSFGTAQAAHILRARPTLIRPENDKSFVFAARTTRHHGYHSAPDEKLIDLSSPALRLWDQRAVQS